MWLRELESDAYHTRSAKKLIIGHSDNTSGSNRVTSFEDAKDFAEQAGFSYQEANARTAENVEESFIHLVDEIVQAERQGSPDNQNTDSPSSNSYINAPNSNNNTAPGKSPDIAQKQKSNSDDHSKKEKPEGSCCIVS